LPLLLKHYENNETAPELFSLGFAAYILFMKATVVKEGKYYGERNNSRYLIQDEQAEVFYRRWAGLSTAALVADVLHDVSFWGTDLNALPNFANSVVDKLNSLMHHGVKETIEHTQAKKVIAA
jgi:tagaturonate reductase